MRIDEVMDITRRRFLLSTLALGACSHVGGDGPDVTWVPSPNYGERNASIDSIVLHYTNGSLKASLQHLCDPQTQVSAHYVIDRDGRIYQLVEVCNKAWHAKKIMNSRSIVGIEYVAAPHQPMSSAQEQSSIRLIRWLMGRYAISPSNIFGHRFTPMNDNTDCPSGLFGDETKEAVDQWVARNLT